MVLTLGLTGLPFTGADVGRCFGSPDAVLLTRYEHLLCLTKLDRV
jgi:alpha 1,3-glucosidase